MSNTKTTLNDLRTNMFLTIDRLLNNSDPEASSNEKIDIETADTIAKLGTVIVNSVKIQSDLVKTIANAQNPKLLREILSSSEVLSMSVPPMIGEGGEKD